MPGSWARPGTAATSRSGLNWRCWPLRATTRPLAGEPAARRIRRGVAGRTKSRRGFSAWAGNSIRVLIEFWPRLRWRRSNQADFRIWRQGRRLAILLYGQGVGIRTRRLQRSSDREAAGLDALARHTQRDADRRRGARSIRRQWDDRAGLPTRIPPVRADRAGRAQLRDRGPAIGARRFESHVVILYNSRRDLET